MINLIDQFLQKFKIYSLLGYLLSLIPKNNNIWIWSSYPFLSDSPKIYYDYCSKNFKDIKHIWIKVRKDSNFQYPDNVICVDFLTLKGLYYFLVAKVIFTNNNEFFRFKSSNQILIDFWHGIPVKSILRFDNKIGPFLDKFAYRTDLRVSSSRFTTLLYSSAFGNRPTDYAETGSVRLDRLLGNDVSSIKLKLELYPNVKYAIYLPTYRKGYRSKIDGNSSFSSSSNFKMMKDYLSKLGYELIIKPHPFEEDMFSNLDNLIYSSDLANLDLTVSDLLSVSDLLITDYSSVFIDYLPLKKPFIIYRPDYNKYKETRNFIFDPYQHIKPFIAYSLDDFDNVINNFSNTDYKKSLDFLTSLYFSQIDDNNCLRLSNFLKNKYESVF